ncbi:MAG: 23S rRNA (adenine(2503)-C(2))-methyltransferase RlmN [Candidatus Edwardsbacteria bacterium]
MNKKKLDLKGFSLSELNDFVVSLGEKPYRAKQLSTWIYKYGCNDFSSMTNFSQSFREKLCSQAEISSLNLAKALESSDGTEKFLFQLSDGKKIESVLIPEKRRITLCLSTQVGCPLGCLFCATAKMGFTRNLSTGEILDQIIKVQSQKGPLTNLVLMGMGEPLLNYEATMKAVRIINRVEGFQMGARKITVSTAGIIPSIERLSEEKLQIKLAVSLNATVDTVRNYLMPINKKYPLRVLLSAIRNFVKITKKRITFEYILISDINDSLKDAERLSKIAQEIPCKINLIPLNPFPNSFLKPPTLKKILQFRDYLYPRTPAVTLRISRGQDILAACGQLGLLHQPL